MPQLIQIGAFLLSIIYVPFITGSATSSRWIFLALSLPTYLLYLIWFCDQTFRFTFVHFLGFLFLLYCFVSFNWSYDDNDGFYYLVKFIILGEAFLIGTTLANLDGVFKALALGVGVSSLFVLFGFNGGLFININTLAELSVIVLVGVCIYKLWWYIPGLIPAIFLNGSRGAILTTGLVGALWFSRKSKPLLVLIALLLALFFFAYWQSGYNLNTILERIDIWKNTLNEINLWGNGLASFHSFGYAWINSRPMFVHNDLLQILFELGLIGAILIVWFFFLVLNAKHDAKFVVISFLIISCFAFPLYLPVSAFIAFLTCGFLVNHRDTVFVKYDVS